MFQDYGGVKHMNKTNWIWQVILIIICIAVGIFIYSLLKPDVKETIKFERNPADQKLIDSISAEMQKKDIRIDSLDNKLDSMNNVVTSITERRKINKIKYRRELEEIENNNADSNAAYIRRKLKGSN